MLLCYLPFAPPNARRATFLSHRVTSLVISAADPMPAHATRRIDSGPIHTSRRSIRYKSADDAACRLSGLLDLAEDVVQTRLRELGRVRLRVRTDGAVLVRGEDVLEAVRRAEGLLALGVPARAENKREGAVVM